MKAIGKFIIVEAINEEVKSNSGLLMSGDEVSRLRYKKSKVISAGTDVTAIKDGDIIYHEARSGHQMKLDSNTYGVILERDVIICM
jgi:co-chaperonin GroES (HSP10)